MAVRDALLALLTAGPAYGFQLHGGLAARTGGRRRSTSARRTRRSSGSRKQGLVEPAGSTDDGLPLHRLTAAGAAAAAAWLGGADAAGGDPWDETVDRVLVARSLPGCDADGDRRRGARAVAATPGRGVRSRRDAASVEQPSGRCGAAATRPTQRTREAALAAARGIRRAGPRRGRARLARRARRRGSDWPSRRAPSGRDEVAARAPATAAATPTALSPPTRSCRRPRGRGGTPPGSRRTAAGRRRAPLSRRRRRPHRPARAACAR